jgi:hypothetical protein
VSVRLEGNVATDEVTIGSAGTLAPSPCVVTPGAPTDCHADFDPDRSGPVTFSVRQGAQPVWLETPADGTGRKLCDTPPVTTCTVTPLWPRWGSIGFDGVPPNDQAPPDVSVDFRVAKAGNGSGTIRSDSLNCGNDCSTEGRFGENETLTAVPDDGSRFDGWRAACGSAPTCRLAIGPVTSLTAVFDKKSGAAGGGSKPGTKPPGRRAFTARVLGVTVRGHGRRRMISIRLRVSAQATVLARLVRGRRQVASHRWRVRPGTRVLRMRVPARARPGAYRVRLTISGGGDRVGITRGVRLRR